MPTKKLLHIPIRDVLNDDEPTDRIDEFVLLVREVVDDLRVKPVVPVDVL